MQLFSAYTHKGNESKSPIDKEINPTQTQNQIGDEKAK